MEKNYFVIWKDVQGVEWNESFVTKKQAEQFNEEINFIGEILTRSQYEKRK